MLAIKADSSSPERGSQAKKGKVKMQRDIWFKRSYLKEYLSKYLDSLGDAEYQIIS